MVPSVFGRGGGGNGLESPTRQPIKRTIPPIRRERISLPRRKPIFSESLKAGESGLTIRLKLSF